MGTMIYCDSLKDANEIADTYRKLNYYVEVNVNRGSRSLFIVYVSKTKD